MELIKAPTPYFSKDRYTVFLAGSIEGDTAMNWQDYISDKLVDQEVSLLNPRRDTWDTSWKQEITNKQFKKQVDWELDGLDQADLIVMYFDKNTKSPISLLELGLYAASNKMVVCCPDGFWRKGNVDIVCERYGIEQIRNLDDLVLYIKKQIK